jgi:hypothetical protein
MRTRCLRVFQRKLFLSMALSLLGMWQDSNVNNRIGQDNILRNVNAIFMIQNFRPICSRVPVGNNVKKMTPETHLVLDVIGNVRVVGGGREALRNAKDIEENADIMEWTCGLREDGDGG